jgi:hypothetical protein
VGVINWDLSVKKAFSSGEGGPSKMVDEEVALSRINRLKIISPKSLF